VLTVQFQGRASLPLPLPGNCRLEPLLPAQHFSCPPCICRHLHSRADSVATPQQARVRWMVSKPLFKTLDLSGKIACAQRNAGAGCATGGEQRAGDGAQCRTVRRAPPGRAAGLLPRRRLSARGAGCPGFDKLAAAPRLRNTSPAPACVWAQCTGPSQRTDAQPSKGHISFPCRHMRLAAASKLLLSPRLMSMKASRPPLVGFKSTQLPLCWAACSCGHLLASMPGGGVTTLVIS